MTKSITMKKLLGTGHRIRAAISFTGLRINEFCKKSGFPSGTIWSWQNERAPLTKKGAKRLSETLTLFGVTCSSEWLLYGTGNPPLPQSSLEESYTLSDITEAELALEISLIKEIEFFQSLNSRHSVVGMRDDSMIPFYERGDYLGGFRLNKEEFIKAINKNCIVKTENDLTLIRKVNKGKKKNTYTLICTNALTKANNQLLTDIALKEISLIIWHRKKV